MAWKFYNYQTDTFVATKLIWMQGNVWAFSASGAYKVYDYWNTPDREFWDADISVAVPTTSMPTHPLLVRYSGTFTELSTGIVSIDKWWKYIICKTATTLVFINAETRAATSIPLPYTFDSTMAVAGNKVFFLEKQPSDFQTTTRSKLHWFDLYDGVYNSTITWNNATMPSRYSSQQQELANGITGHVVITNPAASSIIEFDFNTGAFIRERALTSSPTHIFATQAGKLYVATSTSYIYEIDIPTDVAVGLATTRGTPTAFADDGVGYLWYINGTNPVSRLNKTTKSLRFVPAGSDSTTANYSMTYLGSTSGQTLTTMLVTPTITVQEGPSLVDRVVKPYLFTATSTQVVATRLGSFTRLNTAAVNGGALVTVGPDHFRGD